MSDSWFDQMDKAMQARKVAIAGRDRWQEKVDAAEAAIAELTALRDAPAPIPAVVTQFDSPSDALLDGNGQPAKFPIVLG